MRRSFESVVLAVAGVLIVALVALNVMAATGRFEDDEPETAAAPPAETDEADTTREPAGLTTEPAETVETEPGETETETETEAPTTEAATTEAAPAPRAPPRLVLTAARGDCYLVVRRNAVDGELLLETILVQGDSVDFTGARLWLRLGASANLDATVDGRPIELPVGTVDVVVTRAGAELA